MGAHTTSITTTTVACSHLSAVQVATLLGVSLALLTRWRASHQGPPYYRLGRRVLYSRAELETWLAAQRVGGPSVASLGAGAD